MPVVTDAFPAPRSLSAARLGAALQCHRLYGFKYWDHITEAKNVDSARGALMHKVLERMFGWEPSLRTEQAAIADIPAAWADLLDAEAEYLAHKDDTEVIAALFVEVSARLRTYFTVEDPTVLRATQQEFFFEVVYDGVPLRGVIDRIDTHPTTGAERITDYKAGRPPQERHASERLFQVKMYALARYAKTGRIPASVRLMFLGGEQDIPVSRRIVEWEPTEAGLRTVAQKVGWAWGEVTALHREGDRTPRLQTLCTWCPFLSRCPEGQQSAQEYLAAKAERQEQAQ